MIEPSVILKILREGGSITDIGQLSTASKVLLLKGVRDRAIVKDKDYSFPNPKNRYRLAEARK
jgi:hypothetical protein